jgi:hypothetical protein
MLVLSPKMDAGTICWKPPCLFYGKKPAVLAIVPSSQSIETSDLDISTCTLYTSKIQILIGMIG